MAKGNLNSAMGDMFKSRPASPSEVAPAPAIKKPSPPPVASTAGRKRKVPTTWAVLNTRVSPEVKKQLEIAATLSGTEMALLLDSILSTQLPSIIKKKQFEV